MGDVKTILAVTIVVMSAGTALYTIKTYMQPGTKIALNLAEINDNNLESNEKFESMRQSSHLTVMTTESTISTDANEDENEKENEKEKEEEDDDDDSKLVTTRQPPTTTFTHRITSFKPIKLTTKPVIIDDSSAIYNPDEDVGHKIIKVRRKRSIVSTKLGKVEGIEIDAAGKKLLAFLGLRYAKAPVGNRRFKLSEPITSWSGVMPAKEFGPLCLQYQLNSSIIPLTLMSNFSEDCLHLNIWTPSLSSPLKTVMFFIHGGGFTMFGNAIDELDGRVLSSFGDVVVVSINYRLGPFGFANSGTSDAPGNMGLNDMVLALKWVKDNIESFGGDPNSITLVGHQSGAMSVNMFLLSPITRNLFKRAIMQSGSATVFDFYYKKSFQSTEQFAELLGCTDVKHNLTSDPDSVMKCVREMPVKRLKRAIDDQLSERPLSYSPIIGDEIFPQSPKDLVDDNSLYGSQKEILVGTNSDEGALFFHLGNPDVFRRDKAPTIKDLEQAKQLLGTSLKDWGLSKSTLNLMDSLFLEKTRSIDPKGILKALHDVLGDLAIVCPTAYFSEKFAEKNRTSYFYFFTHRSNAARGDWFGTTHADELPYVFGHPLRYPYKYSGADIDFSKVIMLIWTTFAKTGKPPPVTGRSWPQYNSENQEYVELNGRHLRDGRMGTGIGPHKDNCETWKYAFRLFN